jgi:hypothetical protein
MLLFPQDRADRLRDIRRGQSRRRHLVKQRLEQMMVLAVDQGDARLPALEALAKGQPAKAGSQHDYVI